MRTGISIKKIAESPNIILFCILLPCFYLVSDADSNTAGKAVSGRVLLNGSSLSDVSVNLSGNGKNLSTTASSTGAYAFSEIPNGSYKITPALSGLTFTLPGIQLTVNGADITATKSSSGGITEIQDVKLVSIPAGSFQMGQHNIAGPVHTVTLSTFDMSVYEITQRQYMSVTGLRPSNFTGDDNLPVEKVSWFDAIKFCNALSTKAGLSKCYNESSGACDFTRNGFRLPTEAEWEYACRAGSNTGYNLGGAESDLARAGWYSSNSNKKTHPVGEKISNAWGLYDMHGNVMEWCNDWKGKYTSSSQTNPTGKQTDSSRVIRGGSWDSSGHFAKNCRSAYRSYHKPDGKSSTIGFRVVRRITQ